MTFIYRVHTYQKSLAEIGQSPIDLGKELNRAGMDGWELIQIKPLPGDAGVLLIFKSALQMD